MIYVLRRHQKASNVWSPKSRMTTLHIADGLVEEDRDALQCMRDWIAAQLPDPSQYRIEIGKINSIENAMAAGKIGSNDLWKQKALGVALGDALCQHVQYLRWVSIRDDQGADVALQWKATDILIFPLSDFSSRLSKSEPCIPHDIFKAYAELFETQNHRDA